VLARPRAVLHRQVPRQEPRAHHRCTHARISTS
jgi:hypothetical protein